MGFFSVLPHKSPPSTHAPRMKSQLPTHPRLLIYACWVPRVRSCPCPLVLSLARSVSEFFTTWHWHRDVSPRMCWGFAGGMVVPKKLCSWVREQNERPRMPAEQREGGFQAPASPTTVILGSALFRWNLPQLLRPKSISPHSDSWICFISLQKEPCTGESN